MRVASAPLLGHPKIVASSDPALRSEFGIPPASDWVLLVIKDHDQKLPASTFYGTSATTSTDLKLRKWLLTHRLPTTLELTRDTFQSVMNAPQAPLVVIAAGPLALKTKIMDRLRDIGQKWRVRTDGSGVVHGREAVFTWMDGGEWADWMKSMYGIKDAGSVRDGQENELEDVQVVIADHSVGPPVPRISGAYLTPWPDRNSFIMMRTATASQSNSPQLPACSALLAMRLRGPRRIRIRRASLSG